jgi:uncharacterized membrane protein
MTDAMNLLGQLFGLAWKLVWWLILIPSLVIGSWFVVATVAFFWKVFEPVFRS